MTAPATPPDWDTIARFLTGESDTGEAAVVRAWLEAHPEDRALVEKLDTATVDATADVDVEAALARVHQRMGAPRPSLKLERGGAPATPRRRNNAAVIISGIAAAAAVAFVLTRTRTPEPQAPAAVQRYVSGIGKTFSGDRKSVV